MNPIIKRYRGDRMHKKIAILLCMILVVGSFTGCSKEQQGFLEELVKVGQWEAYDIKLTGTLEGSMQDLSYRMDVPFEGEKVKFDVEGYINVTDECAQLNVNFLDDAKGKIPDFEIFITPDVVCMNRAYLMVQSDTNRFDKIKEKYVSWPMTDELEALQSFKKSEKWYPKVNQIVKDIEVNMPLTQNGRTYTLNLDHDQIGEISKDYAKGLYAHLDEIIALYLEVIEAEMDLVEAPQGEAPTLYEDENYVAYYDVYYNSKAYYEEEAKEFKEEMDKYLSDGEWFEILKYFVQGAVYGSRVTMNTSFTDDSIISTYKGKTQILKQASIQYDVNVEIKKAERHSVNLPKETRNLTLDQYEAYDYAYRSTFYVEKAYCHTTMEDIRKIVQEEKLDDSGYYEEIGGFTTKSDAYVNLNRVADQFGYVVRYDESKKQYYLVAGDEIVYNYSTQLEEMDQLLLKFAAGEITEEEYMKQLETVTYAYMEEEEDEDEFSEVEGAKHLYVATVTIGDDVYAALSELEKIGFESKKEIITNENSPYGVYIYVYEPFVEH